jgi:hypothetical protein
VKRARYRTYLAMWLAHMGDDRGRHMLNQGLAWSYLRAMHKDIRRALAALDTRKGDG